MHQMKVNILSKVLDFSNPSPKWFSKQVLKNNAFYFLHHNPQMWEHFCKTSIYLAEEIQVLIHPI